MKPVHSPPSYCFKIYLIISFFQHPDPSYTFPHKILSCTYPFSHTCHMPRASSWFDRLNSIWKNILRGAQITMFLTAQFSPIPCHLVPLRSSYTFLSTHSWTPSAYFLSSIWETKFQTGVKQEESYSPVYCNHYFGVWNKKTFKTNSHVYNF